MTLRDMKQPSKVVGDAFCAVTVFGNVDLLEPQQSALDQTLTSWAAGAPVCVQTWARCGSSLQVLYPPGSPLPPRGELQNRPELGAHVWPLFKRECTPLCCGCFLGSQRGTPFSLLVLPEME